jgi:hypothetical protein
MTGLPRGLIVASTIAAEHAIAAFRKIGQNAGAVMSANSEDGVNSFSAAFPTQKAAGLGAATPST